MGTVLSTASSSGPLFAAWSAFSLPLIPVCASIQLIVVLYNILAATFLMALVIQLVSSFLFFSIWTAVSESVCMVDLFMFLLAFKSAISMAIISASSTDADVYPYNCFFLLVYKCSSYTGVITGTISIVGTIIRL